MRLEVDRLVAHHGRAPALHAVSFAVGAGEVVALLGRNGAGKSTTLRAVMGLLRPSGGHVRFGRTEITGWEPYRIARAGLGYVPEERRIFADLTVAENLAVGQRGAGWTTDRVFALFPALAPLRHRLGRAMSGGEQQMLTIARTLMGNPRLILLDEPSEGLAPLVVTQLADALLALKREGIGLVLAEPNLRVVGALADRAVVLQGGRVAWSGDPAALAADPGLREQLLAV